MDWQWIHIATFLEMINVFNLPISCDQLNNNENDYLQPPLLIAIKTGKIEMVKAILTCKPDLTLIDFEGNSCLHLSAISSTSLLRLVIKDLHQAHGLTLFHHVNQLGYTPFHLACVHEKIGNVHEFMRIGLTIRLLTLKRIESDQDSTRNIIQRSSQLRVNKDEQRINFTPEMLAGIDFSECKHAGSPLHWCRRQKLMTQLIGFGFKLLTVNQLNETPLHSMIRSKRLDCMLPLLNAGANVDIPGPNGQAPIHFSITVGFREGFQALIVYDCDFNLVNSKNHTPRHRISQRSTPDHLDMLYVLEKLGASRCPAKTYGCKDGCAFKGVFNGHPLSTWPDPIPAQYFNPFRHLTADSNCNSSKTTENRQKKVNMLCIDGGGMKGLFGIQSLLELQKLLDKPLIDHFDWIGATSTGAIIAASLVVGKPLKQLRAEYFELKDEIFNPKRPHNTEALEQILKRNIGADRKINSITDKKLMITAILADRDPPRLYLFRSYLPKIDLNEPIQMDGQPYRSSDDFAVWEAIRASSAAPAFFKPYGPFIDGGLTSNNPTLDCLTEFFNNNNSSLYKSSCSKISIDDDSSSEILNLVLSIGNGKPRPISVGNYDFGNMAFRKNPVGAFRSAIKYITLGELVVKLATHPDNHVVQRSKAWCGSLGIPYYRLNPPLKEKLPLDETRDEKIVEGMLFAKIFMYTIRDQVKEIFDLIKLS